MPYMLFKWRRSRVFGEVGMILIAGFLSGPAVGVSPRALRRYGPG
jgi:hypothetical protein